MRTDDANLRIVGEQAQQRTLSEYARAQQRGAVPPLSASTTVSRAGLLGRDPHRRSRLGLNLPAARCRAPVARQTSGATQFCSAAGTHGERLRDRGEATWTVMGGSALTRRQLEKVDITSEAVISMGMVNAVQGLGMKGTKTGASPRMTGERSGGRADGNMNMISAGAPCRSSRGITR